MREMLWRAQVLRIDKRRNPVLSLLLRREFHQEDREATKQFPQNRDLPPLIPPSKKRYLRPLPLVIWEHKRDKRLGVRRLLKAPLNGMLVEDLIPLAHDVVKEFAVLEEGVKRLMKSVSVKACTCCMEIYVAKIGHRLPTCRGTSSRAIYGQHQWIRGYIEDVIVPIEAYHVYNKLGSSMKHSQRYTVLRLSAVHELCVQAGVDDPGYPTIRWARRSGRQVGDGEAHIPLTRFRNKIVPGYSSAESGSDDEENEPRDEDQKPRCVPRADGLEGNDEFEDLAWERLQEIQKGAVVREGSGPEEDSKAEGLNGKRLQEVQKGDGDCNYEDEGLEAEVSRVKDEDDETINAPAEDEADSGQDKPPKFELKLIEEELVEGPDSEESQDGAQKRELKAVAERTLVAFDRVRRGLQALLRRYKVWACGYCSEVHIGVKPHKVRLCGGLGRGYRDGGHAWQEAALSDIFPPNFVWHVPANQHPRLSREMIQYYGQTPAVVEMCVQAGAEAPPRWKPYMRDDVVIPDEEEMLWAS